ncbi:unnamed protein product [Ceutorhynchus assimilis]|uniref:Uncharacterized protein n=1 Tax=Ceutorhynchus assimilis TaxID=467358 RepID=A0A9N9MC07_9CUCU|nr:unnamed protein product [Ceutorhynchus assimilis]
MLGPRQCIPTTVYPFTRCFHTRSTQCGSYCLANIVHEENRQICSSVDNFGRPANCQSQTAYIPQPQPRCSYTSTWPYVSCGIQPPAACEGCYNHYYNQNVKQYKSCPPQCYDDFSVGPLYRQGPFYQPGYAHIPPCAYSPQGCSAALGTMGGYGIYNAMPGYGVYGQASLPYAGPLSGQSADPSLMPVFPYYGNTFNSTEDGSVFNYTGTPAKKPRNEYDAMCSKVTQWVGHRAKLENVTIKHIEEEHSLKLEIMERKCAAEIEAIKKESDARIAKIVAEQE